MARNRTISPDFWTWEAVIDCAPMTRLLFIGLWNFADDHGVQPLRPRTIRYQVFPGDEIDNEAVRAMIDELALRKLVRLYEVEGIEYLAVVDWCLHHRIGKRARRRYPRDPALPPEPLAEPPSAPPSVVDRPTDVPPEVARWRKSVGRALRHFLPNNGPPDDTEAWIDRWTAKWIAQGCDFKRDIVPVVRGFCRLKPYCGPPIGFQELDEHVARRRAEHEAETMSLNYAA